MIRILLFVIKICFCKGGAFIMFKKMTIQEFTEKLASSAPTPGGGGAAALSAALGAALNCMVLNLTIGKKVYEEYDDTTKRLIQKSLEKAEEAKNEFIEFIDKDADAFQKISSAFKMPKETEEQKKERKMAIAEGYKAAAGIPSELCKRACNVYQLIKTACIYGNKNLISDAGAAAIQIHSAIETSVLNIYINLSGIKDSELKYKLKEEADSMLKQSEHEKQEIMEIVYKNI